MNFFKLSSLALLIIFSFNFVVFAQNTSDATSEETKKMMLSELRNTVIKSLLNQAESPPFELEWYFVDVNNFPGCGTNFSYQKSAANFKKVSFDEALIGVPCLTGIIMQVHVLTRWKNIRVGKQLPTHLWQVRYYFNRDMLAWEYVSIDRHVCCYRNNNDTGFTCECPLMEWKNFSWDDVLTAVLRRDLDRAAFGDE